MPPSVWLACMACLKFRMQIGLTCNGVYRALCQKTCSVIKYTTRTVFKGAISTTCVSYTYCCFCCHKQAYSVVAQVLFICLQTDIPFCYSSVFDSNSFSCLEVWTAKKLWFLQTRFKPHGMHLHDALNGLIRVSFSFNISNLWHTNCTVLSHYLHIENCETFTRWINV